MVLTSLQLEPVLWVSPDLQVLLELRVLPDPPVCLVLSALLASLGHLVRLLSLTQHVHRFRNRIHFTRKEDP